MLGRYASSDQILDDRDGASRRQLPVTPELHAVDGPHIGMSVNPQHPGDFARNFLLQLEERAGKDIQLGATLRLVESGLPGIEEHLGLKNEPVTYNADIGAVAENRAQPSEELRSIAREFLYALSKRDVKALTEIGNTGLGFLVALLGGIEGRFQRSELPAERCDLLVEHFDLRQRSRGEPLF